MKVALVLAVLLAPVLGAQVQNTTSTGPVIVAYGSGEVRLPPDRAVLTISVVTRAATAADAGRQNVERMNAVLAMLRRQALPDSAITTSGYSVGIERGEYGEMPAKLDVPVTYAATNRVQVVLTDLNASGRTIDSALAAGASEIEGIAFTSSQEKEGRRRAIARAVQEARADAEAAATAAGGRLGPLVELSLQPYYFAAGASRLQQVVVTGQGLATPITAANVSATASAHMKFVFLPNR